MPPDPQRPDLTDIGWEIYPQGLERVTRNLLAQWLPRLEADVAVKTIPANSDSLLLMISRRADYQDRAEQDSTNVQP